MGITFPGPLVRTLNDFVGIGRLRQGFQGRIAGQDGKTKFTIENASRTRIILADTWVDVFFRPRHAN